MKRVTLLVDDIREKPANNRALILPGESYFPRHVHARHILAIEDADGYDFAPLDPTAAPVAPRALTTDELDALSVGEVVDATVHGQRARALRRDTRHGGAPWLLCPIGGSPRFAVSAELEDAILVPTPPIQPAPVKALPLPTEPGARFWGKTSDTEPQYWFTRGRSSYVSVGYVPASAGTLPIPLEHATRCGLVRLVDPNSDEVTA
jgi:hypothetical protein